MTNLYEERNFTKQAGVAPRIEDVIVGGDDLVEAGDAQLEDVLRIYSEDSNEALKYRQVLKERGFETSRFKRPVLIRRRLNALTPEERMAFVDSLQENRSAVSPNLVNKAYGPQIARLMTGALPAPVAEALGQMAADWHWLRLAAKEHAPWLEVTPALRAAATALAHAQAADRSVAELILDGALVDTGFTEAAFGFLRLMHDDAALSKLSETHSIVERLRACVLVLETQDSPPSGSVDSQGDAGLASGPMADRAVSSMLTSNWADRPFLETARLSAMTDFDALRQVAAFNDLPAVRLMDRWLGRKQDDPDAVARAGVTAELWLKEMVEILGQLRGAQEDLPGIIDRILMATRDAFDLEALACLAGRREKSFDTFSPDLQAAFVRHGLDAEGWKRVYAAADTGMVDPTRLTDDDMQRLLATIKHAPEAFLALDPESFPVSTMIESLMPIVYKARNGPFAPLFPAALAMTTVAMFALQAKRRLWKEPALDLESSRAWASAYLQSGAGLLIGSLMARIGDAVDGFAHGQDTEGLPRALARFLQNNATGSSLWYLRRGADRLLWDALQAARGRDVGAAYARMTRRYQDNA
jgi:hypothetical protein